MPLREFIEINAAGNGPGHRKTAFFKATEPKGKLKNFLVKLVYFT